MTVHHDTSGLQHVSLFTGVGGIDLALHRAGIPTIAACEIDAAAAAVYSTHFPDVPVHPDIAKVTADDIRRAGAVPERTVLSAGFPCQDLSVAGRRAGLHGARSGLFWHIVRLAAATRPRWLILENVTGLLSAVCPCPGGGACGHPDCADLHPVGPDGACPGGCFPSHGGVMGTVIGALANLGYVGAYRVLDAQFLGVPQRRRRVIIVASIGTSGAAPAEILFEPQGSGRDSAAGGPSGTDAAGGAARGAAGAGGGLLADTGIVRALTERQGSSGIDLTDAEAGHVVVAPVTAKWAKQSEGPAGDETQNLVTGDPIPFDRAQITHPENRSNPQPGDPAPSLASTGQPMVAHALTAEGHDASEDGSSRGTPLIAFDPTAGIDEMPSETTAPTIKAGHGTQPAIAVPSDLSWQGGSTQDQIVGHDAVSPTLAHSSNAHQGHHQPKVIDAQSVRRLTPLECERLQGLPDEWTRRGRGGRVQPDATRYRQLGNSVAVPVFEWVARRLVVADQDERRQP